MVDNINNANDEFTKSSTLIPVPNSKDNSLYNKILQILEVNHSRTVNELWIKKHQGYCLIEWFLIESINLSHPYNTRPLEHTVNSLLNDRDNQPKFVSLLLSQHFDNKNLIQWIISQAQAKVDVNPLILINIIEQILKSTNSNGCSELLNIEQNNVNLVQWYLNYYANYIMNNSGVENFLVVIQTTLKSKNSTVIAELLRIKRDNKNLIQWYLYQYYELKTSQGEESLNEVIQTIAKTRRTCATDQLLTQIPGKNYCWMDWLIDFTTRKGGKDACISFDAFFQPGMNILDYLCELSVELPIEVVSESLTDSEYKAPLENISYLALMFIKNPAKLTTLFPKLSNYLKRSLLFQLIQACKYPKLRTTLYDYIKKIINNTSSLSDRNLFLTLFEKSTQDVSFTSDLSNVLLSIFSEETDPFSEMDLDQLFDSIDDPTISLSSADLDQLFNDYDDLLSSPSERALTITTNDFSNNHIDSDSAINTPLSLPPFESSEKSPNTRPTKSFNIISFSLEKNMLQQKSVDTNVKNSTNKTHSQHSIGSPQPSVIAPISLFRSPFSQTETTTPISVLTPTTSSLPATASPTVCSFLSSNSANSLAPKENNSRNPISVRTSQTNTPSKEYTLEKSSMTKPLNFEADWNKVKSGSGKRNKIDRLLKDEKYLYRLLKHVEILFSTDQIGNFIGIITDVLSSRNAAAIAVFEARIFEGKKILLHYIENAHNYVKNDKLIYNYAIKNILTSNSKAAIEFLIATTINHSEEKKNLIEIYLSTSLLRGETCYLDSLNRCITTGTPLTTYLHYNVKKSLFFTNDSILLTPPDMSHDVYNASSVTIYILKNPNKLTSVLRGKNKPLKNDILTKLYEICDHLQFCGTRMPSLDKLRIDISEQVKVINPTKINHELTISTPNHNFTNQLEFLTGTKRKSPDVVVKYKERKKITTTQMLEKIGFLSGHQELNYRPSEADKEMNPLVNTRTPPL